VGSAGSTLLGVQLVMFGVLSDLLLSLHREQLDRIESLAEEHGGDD
jgi:dolichol-phosphate mannosyltransferase